MSTSCVMRVRQLSTRLLKRVRPSVSIGTGSTTTVALSDSGESDEGMPMEGTEALLLKVCKRQVNSSPRSASAAVVSTSSDGLEETRSSANTLDKESTLVATSTAVNNDISSTVPWPSVKSCDGVRNAIQFLNNSRQHAIMLITQNHWDRAMVVLKKIEKASETVCQQRRKVVLEQSNVKPPVLVEQIQALALEREAPSQRRTVRFSDDVQVVMADEMDRTSDDITSPLHEELLLLRASRSIPRENYSEFWN